MLNARNTCSNDNHNLIHTVYNLNYPIPPPRTTFLHSMDTTEEPSLVNKAPPIYSTHLNIIIISSRIPLHVRQNLHQNNPIVQCWARPLDWLSALSGRDNEHDDVQFNCFPK